MGQDLESCVTEISEATHVLCVCTVRLAGGMSCASDSASGLGWAAGEIGGEGSSLWGGSSSRPDKTTSFPFIDIYGACVRGRGVTKMNKPLASGSSHIFRGGRETPQLGTHWAQSFSSSGMG